MYYFYLFNIYIWYLIFIIYIYIYLIIYTNTNNALVKDWGQMSVTKVRNLMFGPHGVIRTKQWRLGENVKIKL